MVEFSFNQNDTPLDRIMPTSVFSRPRLITLSGPGAYVDNCVKIRNLTSKKGSFRPTTAQEGLKLLTLFMKSDWMGRIFSNGWIDLGLLYMVDNRIASFNPDYDIPSEETFRLDKLVMGLQGPDFFDTGLAKTLSGIVRPEVAFGQILDNNFKGIYLEGFSHSDRGRKILTASVLNDLFMLYAGGPDLSSHEVEMNGYAFGISES